MFILGREAEITSLSVVSPLCSASKCARELQPCQVPALGAERVAKEICQSPSLGEGFGVAQAGAGGLGGAEDASPSTMSNVGGGWSASESGARSVTSLRSKSAWIPQGPAGNIQA